MSAPRYSTVAIVLHWLIAFAVLSMVPMGWWMSDAIAEPGAQATAYRVFQLHKSIGLTILALTALRLGWRLIHVPPAPPVSKAWEHALATVTHAAFYVLLFALPLSGWLYVSTGWSAPQDRALAVATSWFGLVPVPHLPGVAEAAAETRRDLAHGALGAHSLMAWMVLVLAGLHIGAALKHQFIDRDGVLARMAPFLPAPQARPEPRLSPGRGAALWGAAVVAVAVVAALGWMAGRPATGLGPAEAPAAAAAPAAGPAEPVSPGTATAWRVDPQASRITFSGVHAGAPFTGRFERWEAQIWFDPADLAGSKAVADIATGSARTGDATQEGSLGSAEWLDPAGFPTARFEATAFRALGGDRYEAEGTLTLKEQTVPVTLAFTYRREGEVARVEGTTTLDRTAFDLGMASDPSAQWVSRRIEVRIEVVAQPAG